MPSQTGRFDPDAAAAPDSGVFGLPSTRRNSRVILLPVPFDATTSYRPGTADGPAAIRQASLQVDLFDRRFGRVYEQGIFMEDDPEEIRSLSRRAAAAARPIIDAGGVDTADPAYAGPLAQVNAAGQTVADFVYTRTRAVLQEGKVPGTIGGEHSVPFGAIRAVAEAHPGVGILHLDAHMDCRLAFEGFEWSHASIMYNVLSKIPGVGRLVQVGIRDFSEGEVAVASSHGDRVVTHFDDDWAERALNGRPFADLCTLALAPLPQNVYVSFDIDALEPSLCPHTGTPVPGGLSFNQATVLLDALRKSGRNVVGFDLVEVAPGPGDGPEIDANVGARVLYRLCGLAVPR